MGTSKPGRALIGQLLVGARTRKRYVGCEPTPANCALAYALRRARFLDWATVGGPHPPPPSVILEFTPEELSRRNMSAHSARHKHVLWAGLRFHERQKEAGANGLPVPGFGTPKPAVPVISTIRGWSPNGGDAIWLPGAQLADIVHEGQAFGEKDFMAPLEPGQGIFLQTDNGVFEIREALERGLGGHLICRVWPSVPDPAETTENAGP